MVFASAFGMQSWSHFTPLFPSALPFSAVVNLHVEVPDKLLGLVIAEGFHQNHETAVVLIMLAVCLRVANQAAVWLLSMSKVTV